MGGVTKEKLDVLVAEDSEELANVLRIYLEAQGHRVRCISNGDEALRLVQQDCCDVLVTDIVMPGADGLELITLVRKRCPATRIIAISGGGFMIDEEYCIRAAKGLGAHAVMPKPFTVEEFSIAFSTLVSATARLE